MRNLYEEMALFSIKIERIKQNAHDKLSALQDELNVPTELEAAPEKLVVPFTQYTGNGSGFSGLEFDGGQGAIGQAAMRQYDAAQREGMLNVYNQPGYNPYVGQVPFAVDLRGQDALDYYHKTVGL